LARFLLWNILQSIQLEFEKQNNKIIKEIEELKVKLEKVRKEETKKEI